MIRFECFTNWRKGITLSACFVFTLILISSCKKKDPSSFGTDTFSIEDLLSSGATDTFKLITYSVNEDSIPTGNQNRVLLGAYHDPKLGTFNASFYTQLLLKGATAFQGTEIPTVDSVVLSLTYSGYYGNLTAQTFKVEELGDDLSFDDTYYKNSTIATTGSDLVDPTRATQTPRPTTKVVLGPSDTAVAHLRLKLDAALGVRFLNDAISNNPAFATDEAFLTYFKGLKVSVVNGTPATGTGGVLYFNLSNSVSNLTVFYKVQGDLAQRSLVFASTDNCVDFNHVDIDNSSSPLENTINNPSYSTSEFYTQAFKSRGVVEFPSLNNIPKNSVVQSAFLYLPIAYQTNSVYYPGNPLTVGYKTDAGTIVGFIPQAAYSESNKGYLIDMRGYVQDIVSKKAINRGVYLYPFLISSSNFFSSTAERVIFNGPNTSNKMKPKLIVKYSEF